jgi:hypothetical protein
MPRRVQDIVPGNHRSIRDIPVEHIDKKPHLAKAHRGPFLEKVEDVHIHKETLESVPKKAAVLKEDKGGHKIAVHKSFVEEDAPARRKKGNGMKWFLLSLGILIIVAGIGFIASTYFSRATFTIVPKTISVEVNGTYVAQHASASASQISSAEGLTYETVTVRRVASTTVPATEGPTISTKAQGKLIIYNAYSVTPQQLIAGSRLSNSSGRIYRLTGTITVPAMEGNTPGTIAANVIADEPGAVYNISRSASVDDFRFLGYKGTPRYEGFYARLSTEISGGYEGKKKTVDPAVLASTTAAIKAALVSDLASHAKEAVPEGYIMYDSMNTTSYSDPAIGGTDPTKAEVSITGVFNGIIFKKTKLATRLAGSQAVNAFGKFSYETPGLEDLDLVIANAKDFSAERKTPLFVKGSGNFKVVGVIPVDEIRSKLAGVPLAHTQEILQEYGPVIQSGSGELVPPWSKVPSDPKRILVVVKGSN